MDEFFDVVGKLGPTTAGGMLAFVVFCLVTGRLVTRREADNQRELFKTQLEAERVAAAAQLAAAEIRSEQWRQVYLTTAEGANVLRGQIGQLVDSIRSIDFNLTHQPRDTGAH